MVHALDDLAGVETLVDLEDMVNSLGILEEVDAQVDLEDILTLVVDLVIWNVFLVVKSLVAFGYTCTLYSHWIAI